MSGWLASALDIPCPVCDARVAEWCINGTTWSNVHLDRAAAANAVSA